MIRKSGVLTNTSPTVSRVILTPFFVIYQHILINIQRSLAISQGSMDSNPVSIDRDGQW